MIDKGRLGPFVLEQRLGQQKQGAVYHAVHIQRRRAMAVRLMSQHLGQSGTSVQEFAREVEFLKSLEHPNVVRVYGGGVYDDEAYLAMELVQGESLDQVLAARRYLPWQTVVAYATQVCEGLEYAHQRGTIHQNLSTAKLLLTPEGQIKITDFRGNRLNEYDRWDAQPHLSAIPYLSPEQLRGEKNVSPKTDLYALGCILYELLAGRPPFEATTTIELREKHLHETPPRVSAAAFDCPIWLDALVAQLLEKDPHKRPHYASAVNLALHEMQENVNTGIVGHAAAAGSSALKRQVGDTAIKRLLKRKTSTRRQQEWVPFYERAWFLASCAALVIALCTWAFWPASEEQLFAKAQVLMASDDRAQWQEAAERYLEPMLARFPEGKHAEQGRKYLEQIELKTTQVRLELIVRGVRRGKTAAERRCAEALELEQDGELQEALAAYEEAIQRADDTGEDAPLIKLAQQQIEKLKPAVALAIAAENAEAPDAENRADNPSPARATDSPPLSQPESPVSSSAPLPSASPP